MIKIASSQKELDEIVKYAVNKNFDIPYSKTIVYEKRDDKIVGVIGIDDVVVIEPLISNSALISNNLYYTALGIILTTGKDRIECFTTDEQYKKIGQYFERQNFQFIEKTNRFVKLLNQ